MKSLCISQHTNKAKRQVLTVGKIFKSYLVTKTRDHITREIGEGYELEVHRGEPHGLSV